MYMFENEIDKYFSNQFTGKNFNNHYLQRSKSKLNDYHKLQKSLIHAQKQEIYRHYKWKNYARSEAIS